MQNLTAEKAQSTEIVSKTQQTKALIVTVELNNDKCNTTETTTPEYISDSNTIGENIVYRN